MARRDEVMAMSDEQIEELVTKAEAHDDLQQELERSITREKAASGGRRALAKRLRRKVLEVVDEHLARATAENDRQQSAAGDGRVAGLGTLKRALERIVPPEEEEDATANTKGPTP